MKVYFNLPGLFEKFHIVKQTILLYENYPYIFRDNFIISSFYGSNGGVANGGRNSGHFNNEKEVENFCKEHNLCPTIIFSSFLICYASFDSFIKHIHIVLLCLPVVWPNNGLNGITDKTSAAFI